MAYSEVIKNFGRIREDMRQFYVYGFKSRDEYTKKSGRSYDDERRRLESWLGDYVQFRQTPEKKTVFLSIDSRLTHHNPLYRAWKAKSFTDGDIILHFLLMDLLPEEEGLSLNQIADLVDERLSVFEEPKSFEESTIRKKLKEYVQEGIVLSEKRGKTMYYKRPPMEEIPGRDVLDFFSETAPCGVIGSFLLDKEIREDENGTEGKADRIAFKHHYITSALDSEILCCLFSAMNAKRMVTLDLVNRSEKTLKPEQVVPLQIMISVQNGRQHLMAYVPRLDRIRSYRVDYIQAVTEDDVFEEYDLWYGTFCSMQEHIWGVSTQGQSGERMEHVDFTVRYNSSEGHIHGRLEREKRCGLVERLDESHSRFSADVYDVREMFPWIRSFLCRITEIRFSDESLREQFFSDLEEMYRMYGIGEPEGVSETNDAPTERKDVS